LVGAGLYVAGAAITGIILVVLELHVIGFLRRMSTRKRTGERYEPERDEPG
jgi:hypothetical protein